MNLFFDTSALVKLFHSERGSDIVADMVAKPDNRIWVLDLVRAEFSSALHRRYRNHEIEQSHLETALAGFDLQLRLFTVQPLGTPVLDEAILLLARYGKSKGLRTLDALQIGAFSLLQEEGWAFVCADKNLSSIAVYAGYEVIDPTAGE